MLSMPQMQMEVPRRPMQALTATKRRVESVEMPSWAKISGEKY
jgi:hypothetical protein